ncbi:type IV secretion system DNA-binding domain-containing protein [Candidatus Curtissbacteria bacterium]|nr:type IV secretion system DNA-binding domain-containing protein [Candidatus Curtissbacteria bacterium]
MDIQQFRADYIIARVFRNFNSRQFVGGISHSLPTFFSLVLFALSFAFVFLLVKRLLLLRKSLKEESVLLELTPPAITEKTAYTTQQLFSVIHNLAKRKTFQEKLLGKKTLFSFEIASSLNQGIRYLIRTTPKEANNVKRSLLSYLPQVSVKTVADYLPGNSEKSTRLSPKIIEFNQQKHFAYPLKRQDTLSEHDPVAYITGMMTKLKKDELVAFQLILSQTKTREAPAIKRIILRNGDLFVYLDRFRIPSYIQPLFLTLKLILGFVKVTGNQLQWAVTELANGTNKNYVMARQFELQQQSLVASNVKPARILSSFEQETVSLVQSKIDQSLFEATARVLVMVKDDTDQRERVDGFIASLETFSVPGYQSLVKKSGLPDFIWSKVRFLTFQKRLLSLFGNSSSSLLSVSEVSDLYHFPFQRVNQTEDIVKVKSKDLPAPLSLKQGSKLAVVFGNNSYAGTTTPIGLTGEERKTHMYIIGRTGSGKTTLMFSMAKHDIENGEGLAFIDPHGDVSEDLLACVPESRKDDLIYLNPFDLKYPIGINLLELTPGLDEDEAELEREVVAEGVVSLFRKVFSKEENANAHRIEYILRNTIHTVFTTESPTIFTIYDLLNNPPFRKQVVDKLQDENLKNFWEFEFGKAGDYQVVKMVGGVTSKIGRFLFSPTAKRILEQKKSTIDFSEILNGKILICNLSQGKLGEDTARLLGTTILTKIQQAALKRADIPQNKRRQFHLYVDEFQNFATLSFSKMLSEGRKYGLEVYIAEQSTSQQEDRSIVNVILGNVTTVVCFRTGNPVDEDLLLEQFSPYVQKGEIYSLPRYHFYIKISAIESEDPFSGVTIFTKVKKDPKKRERLIEASRKNNAIVYKKPEPKQIVNAKEDSSQNVTRAKGNTASKKFTPEEGED